MKLTLRELRSASVLGPLADLFLHRATTLSELVHASPRHSYEGKPCTVTPRSFNKSGDTWFATYQVFGTKDDSDPAGHRVKIKFYPEATVATPSDLEIEVTCSCPAFLYWGAQYFTHGKDALWDEPRPLLVAPQPVGVEFLDKNGRPRTHHTPRDYVVCKHIHAVSERVNEQLTKHHTKHKEDTAFKDRVSQDAAQRVKEKEERARARQTVPPTVKPDVPQDEEEPLL